MRALLPLLLAAVAFGLFVQLTAAGSPHGADVDDNEFAEFEDFDDDEEFVTVESTGDARQQEPKKVVMAPEAAENEADLADDDDATVEEDDDEFEHFQDEDEFEGFDIKEKPAKGKGQDKPPDLKIASVPLHLRTNWDSFYMEMLMLAGLGVYFLNFLAGKSKNSKLAQTWLTVHKDLLEANFSVVGDDGTSQEAQSGILMKESENIYSLWCSGRVCCEGMLVTLKLLKRQDLVSSIARMFKPASDQIVIKVTMDETEMSSFVMCLANKKVCNKLQKDMNDLSYYCPEKKNVEKFGVPSSFQLLTEVGEASASVLDSKVIAALQKYENLVEFIHISDQYAGLKQQDDSQPQKLPDTEKVLIFCFNAPGHGKCSPKDIETMKPLLQMVFHVMEKVRKVHLSKEAKLKVEKNRAKVQETFLKAAHTQRTEAAQARKEEKRRAEKDRIMNENDPDKQRRLEERNQKKEAKKKQTRVKMMKVKM